MRVYSHSYWLVIFCTTNCSRVLARERWETFENSWKKRSIYNEHPVSYCRIVEFCERIVKFSERIVEFCEHVIECCENNVDFCECIVSDFDCSVTFCLRNDFHTTAVLNIVSANFQILIAVLHFSCVCGIDSLTAALLKCIK